MLTMGVGRMIIVKRIKETCLVIAKTNCRGFTRESFPRILG